MSSTLPIDHGRRLALARRLARWALLLMLATVLLSAFMRLSQMAAPCPPGPACAASVGGLDGVALARGLHRVVATAVLGLAIALVVVLRRARPSREHRLSRVLLVLVIALAGLGLVTPGARVPAVAIGNLLGGFAVVLACARLAQTRPPPPALHGHALLASALLVAQIALGAQLGASFSAGTCGDALACLKRAGETGWDLQAFDPWRPIARSGPGPGAAAVLHLAHAAGAVLCAVVLLALSWRAWRAAAPRTGGATAALVVLQGLLGALQLSWKLPIALVLAHNLTALGMLVLTASLWRWPAQDG